MRFLLIRESRGIHVRARVFAGPDEEHFAYIGELVMRLGEWAAFIAILDAGRQSLDDVIMDFRDGELPDPSRHVARNSGPE
jgi:hypothetical protein